MRRPEISVVMPFAGTMSEAEEALRALRALDAAPGDELILVDNSGNVPSPSPALEGASAAPEIAVVRADGERSPAHARNVGAAHATAEWILFLDADTRPRAGLLSAFFMGRIGEDVGAVAGEVVPALTTSTLVARYGRARSFLSQQAHHQHPFRPRAAAANLLVRRAAFEQLSGFYEGLRAAEDTDFTWRLQEAGWRLELRPQAQVEHRYRSGLRDLRRQWRGYAAGRAWLARRYDGFVPEPALRRAARRTRARVRSRAGAVPAASVRAAPRTRSGAADQGRFLALDAVLSVEELAGLTLSNRPARAARGNRTAAAVVLIADRFPARGDPLVELADSLERARVEAVGRPQTPDLETARRLAIDYLEDDGQLARLVALIAVLLRHPVRSLRDRRRRSMNEPALRVLAPAVRRLEHDAGARLHVLGTGPSRAMAERLARLAGRTLE